MRAARRVLDEQGVGRLLAGLGDLRPYFTEYLWRAAGARGLVPQAAIDVGIEVLLRLLVLIDSLVPDGAERQMALTVTNLPKEYEVRCFALGGGPFAAYLRDRGIDLEIARRRWKYDPLPLLTPLGRRNTLASSPRALLGLPDDSRGISDLPRARHSVHRRLPSELVTSSSSARREARPAWIAPPSWSRTAGVVWCPLISLRSEVE